MISGHPSCCNMSAKMSAPIGPIPNPSSGGDPPIWIPRAGPTSPPTPTSSSSLDIPTNTGSGPRVQTTPFSVFGDELQSVLVIVGGEPDLQLFPADSFGAYAYRLPTFPLRASQSCPSSLLYSSLYTASIHVSVQYQKLHFTGCRSTLR